MHTINKMASLVAIATSISCSVSKDENGSDGENSSGRVIEESMPTDSTGLKASVTLAFGSSFINGLMLDDPSPSNATAPSVKIGQNIILTYAKFNVAKIKVKAPREQSAEEKALEQEEAASETTAVASVEQLTDATATSSASLTGRPADNGTPSKVKGQKAKRDEALSKVKEHREALKAKESQTLENEVRSDKSTKFTGPYIYDAVLGKIEGDAPTVDLMEGTYRRVEFQLKRNFQATEGDPLLRNVFAIRGTVLKSDGLVPFEIDWHVALNFRMAGDKGISVTAGENNAMVIDFNLNKWFEGIDLTQATIDEDGKIYVNKTSNQAILNQLHKNIKISSGFGKDKNKDGTLSDDERSGKGEDTTDASVP